MQEGNRDLKKAIAVGAVWVTVLRLAYRLIGLISIVFLARLLTPEDFGVAAIAMSIFALINTISRFGFETVIVQLKDPLAEHYSSAWSFNLIFGVISAVLLAGFSGYIGDFYQSEDIALVTIVVSLLFLLNGLKNTGVVDFQKNMTFEKEFRLHIIPKFISFFVTIALALYFRNYWALVIGNVVLKILEVANSYLMHAFRPSFTFSKAKDLFGFSKWLMANNLLTFLNTKSPELILGKLISPHAAAIYNLASEIGKMTTSEIIANLNRAIYPGYAKVSGDLAKLQDLYKDSISVIALIVMPLGVGVALVSSSIVPIMLGDQWVDATVPLVYLALGGAINALKSNSNYLYFSLGKPKIATFELLVRAVVFLGSIYYFVSRDGVNGAAQAFFVSSIVMFVISNFIVRAIIEISIIEQFGLYFRPLTATLFMAVIVYGWQTYFSISNFFVGFLLEVFAGVLSYFGSVIMIWYVVGKNESVEKKIFEILKEKLKRKIG